MRLEEITLYNFGSFVDKNVIEFGPDLTLFIGDNGDGKTTFFDALKWVLDTAERVPPIVRLSARIGRELTDGDRAECYVQLVFTHKGKRFILKKSFFVFCEDGVIKSSDSVNLVLHIENPNGERVQADAHNSMEEIFDTSVREFCLFKGETELHVLSKKKALGQLLSKLSDISQFDKYKASAEKLDSDASKALNRELRNNQETSEKSEEIQKEVEAKLERAKSLSTLIRSMKEEVRQSEEIYNELKNNQKIWRQYNDLEEERKKISDKKIRLQKDTDIDLNIKLLDDLWVLENFSPVFNEFKNKVAYWRDRRQELRNERMKEEERNKSRYEIGKEFRSRLPIQVPDESTLEALIKAERCDVCGREAKKGTPAYEHMCRRLEELKKYLEGFPKDPITLPPLFNSNYIGEINELYRSLTGTTQAELNRSMHQIPETLLNLARNKKQLVEQNEELERIDDDIQNLLITNHIEDEGDFFGTSPRQFYESARNIGEARGKEAQLKEELDGIYSDIDKYNEALRELGKNDPQATFLSHVKDVLSQITLAFRQGREKNADDFVNKLQERSNYFLEKLSVNDFRGFIKLERNKETDGLTIHLVDSSDREIVLPNAALKTSQYLAVLFAISDLTSDKNKEAYPLVFDAPTSSFSVGKEDEFYNTVDQLHKQCVILTKDLLLRDGSLDEERISRLNCWVYRLRKSPGFKQGDLSTIKTEVIRI